MQQHRASASPFGQLPEPTVAKTHVIGHEPDCPIFGINLAASLGDFTLRRGYLQTDLTVKRPAINTTIAPLFNLYCRLTGAASVECQPGDAQREEFHGKFTGKSGAQLKSDWSKLVFSGTATPPKEIPGGNEAKALIAANPNAIGYPDKASVDGSLKLVLSP